MKTNKGKVIPDISLELMDWKQVEQHSEEAIRKQMIDLQVTRNVRRLAKMRIIELGGQTSEKEKADLKKSIAG